MNQFLLERLHDLKKKLFLMRSNWKIYFQKVARTVLNVCKYQTIMVSVGNEKHGAKRIFHNNRESYRNHSICNITTLRFIFIISCSQSEKHPYPATTGI